MGKIRGTHSSPGIYTQITDIEYAAKTLGITTAGLVGETLQGPAFEPIMVKDFNEFQSVFGGTSAEKFKGSQYPKYELPYIAKSYLTKSDQLYVCRVLGLSGYNAGPAFVITASKSEGDADERQYVIAVLRSRGGYNETGNFDPCKEDAKYDTLQFRCNKIELKPYNKVSIKGGCEPNTTATQNQNVSINSMDFGQFTLVTNPGTLNEHSYSVSLNANDKDYIYKVLGSNPLEGNADIFIEELYDFHLEYLINNEKVDKIDVGELPCFGDEKTEIISEPVSDIAKKPSSELTKRMVGKTYLNIYPSCIEDGETYTFNEKGEFLGYVVPNDKNVITTDKEIALVPGQVYKVQEVKYVKDNGVEVKLYKYVQLKDKEGNNIELLKGIDDLTGTDLIKVLSEDVYYCKESNADYCGKGTYPIVPYLTPADYHEQFRCATTPWFVSQATTSVEANDDDTYKTIINVNRLFRFHTISDGNNANAMFKVSIANILPDAGTFDVLIRDYYDSDAAPIILESYKNVTLTKGDSRYIGLKIGTLDGEFSLKSKYVMIELNDKIEYMDGMVPCGFLGYPVRTYPGLVAPSIVYNTSYDNNIRDKKQYFGMSDITGVDFDVVNYKGKTAYLYETEYTTKAFHLDSYMNVDLMDSKYDVKYTIDNSGEPFEMEWDTVSPNEVTEENLSPTMGTELEMKGTIYENVKLRKFTCYPYGGFDGWDIYRDSRTTGDEFKATKYKGRVTNDVNSTFTKLTDNATLNLSGRAITSDYYAFLAGAKQFEDPERHVINLFATPGIDYVNDKELSTEILEMIEEKRMDSLYIMTTPDKPKGASDLVEEMFTPDDAVSNLEDSDIDSYYATTYYPWVKYFDKENNVYINLPATKDAIRNMADVDNKKYPWYAPAGIERGNVECKKMHFFAKLEDEDTLYDGRINPLKTYSRDGVKIWGNKTMYTADTPMDRINVVRLMLYMRKLIIESTRGLIFEPNDITLKAEFESIVNPILAQIKKDRGITDFRLDVSQTPEQMDAHELSATLYVKPTPTLEYIEINFVVTPQGVSFDSL
jgi:hypothetical protein